MSKNKIIFTAIFLAIALIPAAAFAGESVIDLIEEFEKGEVRRKEAPRNPCPDGRECSMVASFVKPDYRSEAKRFQVGALTADRGYDRLVLMQLVGEKHGVIVNTVKVRTAGRWTSYTKGLRLPEGRTAMAVPVPRGAEEIVISFDHGRGAVIDILLERDLPQPEEPLPWWSPDATR